jgi:hypothetical protein
VIECCSFIKWSHSSNLILLMLSKLLKEIKILQQEAFFIDLLCERTERSKRR